MNKLKSIFKDPLKTQTAILTTYYQSMERTPAYYELATEAEETY